MFVRAAGRAGPLTDDHTLDDDFVDKGAGREDGRTNDARDRMAAIMVGLKHFIIILTVK